MVQDFTSLESCSQTSDCRSSPGRDWDPGPGRTSAANRGTVAASRDPALLSDTSSRATGCRVSTACDVTDFSGIRAAAYQTRALLVDPGRRVPARSPVAVALACRWVLRSRRDVQIDPVAGRRHFIFPVASDVVPIRTQEHLNYVPIPQSGAGFVILGGEEDVQRSHMDR